MHGKTRLPVIVKMNKSKNRLRINLLGKPEVWLNNEQLISFNTSKTEALLYYLAATKQTHSRETLASLLWSEMPEAKARRNLTKSLSVLRRLLEPFLIIEPQQVGFNPDVSFELDVTRLESAAAPSPEIINLYRGDFLAGFFVKDALSFEAWQLTRREQLREKVIEILAALTTQAADHKDYETGIEYGRRLLELDPWRESAHRQLMRLLARHGQPAAALAQYEKCRQILNEELGVAPSAETNALYERLRLARDRVPTPLPDDGTQFVGRQQELAFILEQLAQPDCRLLTIVGLGGMGKTRLALAAAQAVDQGDAVLFLNGVTYVPLTGVTSNNGMLAAILSALDTKPRPGQLLDQVITNLRQRELLLVLDNFEELIGEIAAIQQIVSDCPDVTLLVTSREALGISAEHRLDLEGLAAPTDAMTLQDVAAFEAVKMFTSIAQQVQSGFSLDEATGPHVLAVCQLVAGMPLAIKLAASWLHALPMTEIVAQLQAGIDILATRMRDVPMRQRSMRAIFDQTLAQLTEDEVTVLVSLSTFRGGFSAEAARQVAKATPFVLSELVSRGLVQLDETSRYDMHELLRQYTAEQLDATATMTYAEYFATWMAARMTELRDERQGEALRQIALEFGNVKVAWHVALAENQTDWLMKMARPLSRFAHLRGRYPEGIAMLEPAIDHVAALGHTSAEAKLRDLLGTLYFFSGKHDAGEQAFREALRLAELVSDSQTLGNASFHLAQVLDFNEHEAEVLPLLEHAHQHYTQVDNVQGLIGTMNMLGQYSRRQGNINEAHYWFQGSIELGRTSNNYAALLVGLNNFGLLRHELGDFAGSLALFDESEDLLQKMGTEQDGLVMLNFGRNYEALGHIDKATALYEGAIPVFEGQHSQHYALVARSYASRAARLRGDLEQARQWVNEALHGFRKANTRFSIAVALANLGDIELTEAKLDSAEKAYDESLQLMRQLGETGGELRNVTGLARVAMTGGELTTAREWLELGVQISAKTHEVIVQYPLLAALAAYFGATGEAQHGLALLNWIQQQPTAMWETRQFAQKEAAVLDKTVKQVAMIAPERPIAELLSLDPNTG